MNPRTADQLIAQMKAMSASRCTGDGKALCWHERLMSIASGYADEPRCVTCLCDAVGQPPERLVPHLVGTFEHRTCFGGAWSWATAQEPECRLAAAQAATLAAAIGAAAEPDVAWDAGDKGCGDLVLELRLRMRDLAPGTVLELTATDPGAPADIPAWCGLTGHTLLRAEHPRYRIRRRDGP